METSNIYCNYNFRRLTMNVNECWSCKFCDTNKTNDIAQVWCKKFKTYINLFDSCDYFAFKGAIKELEE